MEERRKKERGGFLLGVQAFVVSVLWDSRCLVVTRTFIAKRGSGSNQTT